MAGDGHVDEAGSGGAPGGLTRHRTPLRDNLEWIAFIVLVVLVVRQMVVEAFRIQHGSMAPTLLGIHREIRCPNCGRVFDVGEARIGPGGQVQCPNCDYHWEGAGTYGEDGELLRFRRPKSLGWLWNSATTDNGTPLRSADAANRIRRDACRIFVNKFIYQLRKPRRWEVVVFQYPVFSLECRLCGWQGQVESLEDAVCPDCGSQEFEVTTKDFIKRVAGLPGESVSLRNGDVYVDGRIARKPRDIQKELWFHVFDSSFTPRQEVAPTWDFSAAPGRWQSSPQDGTLLVDARGARSPVMGSFARRIVDFYPYDGLRYDPERVLTSASGLNEVGDCRIRAGVHVEDQGQTGAEVLLSIDDDGHRFVFSVSGGSRGRAVLMDNGETVRETHVRELDLREPMQIALENYDDRVVCWLRGSELFGLDYEPRPSSRHGVHFGGRGAEVVWDRIVIERDVYYTAPPAEAGRLPVYRLGDDEYFVLGDNSPASSDSRRWNRPGVPEHKLIGKAFFVFWPVHRMKWLAGGLLGPAPDDG